MGQAGGIQEVPGVQEPLNVQESLSVQECKPPYSTPYSLCNKILGSPETKVAAEDILVLTDGCQQITLLSDQ